MGRKFKALSHDEDKTGYLHIPNREPKCVWWWVAESVS